MNANTHSSQEAAVWSEDHVAVLLRNLARAEAERDALREALADAADQLDSAAHLLGGEDARKKYDAANAARAFLGSGE